jgi:hypothetical protein
MIDILKNTSERGNAGGRLFNSTRVDEVIEQIYPDKQSMGMLRETIENEGTRSRLRNEVLGGSPTQPLRAAQERIEGNREMEAFASIRSFIANIYNRELDPSKMSEADFAKLSEKLFEVTTLDDIVRIMSTKGRGLVSDNLMENPASSTIGTAAAGYLAEEQADYDL